MPKRLNLAPTDEEQILSKEILHSHLSYQEWESRYLCNTTEKYYEGFHWKEGDASSLRPYTFNLINATIQIKLSSYLFANPKYVTSCIPGKSDFDLDFAIRSAQLKEDTLNTIIRNPHAYYSSEIRAAFKDSFFRFGIIEVGYGADWITNPNAGKPVLKSHEKQNIDPGKDKIIRQPDELPENERVFFKRIDPKAFRIIGKQEAQLERCNKVGYGELVYKADLAATLNINLEDLSGGNIGTLTNSEISAANLISYGGDIIKIWHIWNNRSKKRMLVLETGKILWQKDFKRLPLLDFRWDEPLTGWYPIPPVFNWLSPQDEINEVREQARAHRRKFTRKYLVAEGKMDDDEIEKIINGPDGSFAKVKSNDVANVIIPMPDAALNVSSDKAFIVSKDDFNIISGTSSETRGVADRTTATQAQIIDKRSSVREDYEGLQIANWLCNVGREALLLMREKFSSGVWIRLNTDPGPKESFLGEVQETQAVWKYIETQSLDDGYDVDIAVDIVSMSPLKAEEEKKKFLEFIAVVAQYPQISLSPSLVREAAYRVGYRNERVIKEMANMALMNMLGMQAQSGMQGSPSQQGNPTAQRTVAQQTPNNTEQIRQQLEGQMVQ